MCLSGEMRPGELLARLAGDGNVAQHSNTHWHHPTRDTGPQSGAGARTENTVTVIMLLSGRRLSGEYPKVSIMNIPGIQLRIIIPINFELVMFGSLILFELVNY